MKRTWHVTQKLEQIIRHLPPDLKQRFGDAADFIQKNPEAGKPLEEELAGLRSYRIGKYRLIYRITENRLILESFGPRKDIYDRLILEIGRQKIRERSARYAAVKHKKTKPAA